MKNKKFIISIILLIFFIFQVSSRGLGSLAKNDDIYKSVLDTAFSRLSFNYEIDIISNTSYNFNSNSLNMSDKIKEVKIIRTNKQNNEKTVETLKFNKGLLVQSHSETCYDYDDTTIFEYDSSNRIIKSTNGYIYKYYDTDKDNLIKRDIFLQDKYSRTQLIRLIDNGFELVIKDKDELWEIHKYLYKDGLISKIVRTSFIFFRGESAWMYFVYEKGLLKEVIRSAVEKNNILYKIKISYNNDLSISEIEEKFFRKGEIDSVKKSFLRDYDKYGNWHYAEYYDDNVLTYIYKRDIKYN